MTFSEILSNLKGTQPTIHLPKNSKANQK